MWFEALPLYQTTLDTPLLVVNYQPRNFLDSRMQKQRSLFHVAAVPALLRHLEGNRHSSVWVTKVRMNPVSDRSGSSKTLCSLNQENFPAIESLKDSIKTQKYTPCPQLSLTCGSFTMSALQSSLSLEQNINISVGPQNRIQYRLSISPHRVDAMCHSTVAYLAAVTLVYIHLWNKYAA